MTRLVVGVALAVCRRCRVALAIEHGLCRYCSGVDERERLELEQAPGSPARGRLLNLWC